MVEKARLGDVLVAKGVITQKQLGEALQLQKKKGGFLGQILLQQGVVSSAELTRAVGEVSVKVDEESKLGKALLSENILTPEQLQKALDKQKTTHQPLAGLLIDMEFAKPEQIAKAIGKYWNIPYVALSKEEPQSELMQLLPEEFMRRYQLAPLKLKGNTLMVAMVDPLNILAIDEIKLLTNYQVEIRVTTGRDISLVLDKNFSIQRVAKEALLGMKVEDLKAPLEQETAAKVPYKLDEGPVIKLVDTILDGGINAKASDIHLEPMEIDMRVRYRIDGILHDILTVPKGVESAVVSRIKVLAEMNIAEKRVPQDGHITVKREGKEFDLRVSSFPTVGGEKVVLRILDKGSMMFSLNELGLPKKEENVFKALIERPFGIILVTGPTGSGKTTTLYAALNKLNTVTKNIITVEDPVEYRLEGVSQSQINQRAGITFATGLKAILRQDPDIIMVGEIRDLETAEIAIRAALTGHLVFSTLHTNDAPSAVTRLVDMGIEPFLIASSVIGIMAQRLIRTVCKDCKERYAPSADMLKMFDLEKRKKITFAKGKGCSYCIGTGYHGRMAVYELMKVSDNIRDLIGRRAPTSEIKEAAVKEGMSTLKQSAIDKVAEGLTTPEEVRRAVFAEGM